MVYNCPVDFLKELEEFRYKIPRPGSINFGSVNSDYCTHSDWNKNSYLIFAGNYNEDTMYSGIVIRCKDCADCFYTQESELCYECVDCIRCYNCNYGQDLFDCTDCSFCIDCIGCNSCFGCVNQRNQRYKWFNEQLSKEEYAARLKKIDFKNREYLDGAWDDLKKFELKFPKLYSHQKKTVNCIGDYIESSKNCYCCFDVYEGSEDCMYLQDCWNMKDSADCMFTVESSLCYEIFSCGRSYNCNFCSYIRTCSDCEYCELCFNCKNCFGCVSLQRKEYCILNKQYEPEEYKKQLIEIKSKMNRDGIYGQHLSSTYKTEDTAYMYYFQK